MKKILISSVAEWGAIVLSGFAFVLFGYFLCYAFWPFSWKESIILDKASSIGQIMEGVIGTIWTFCSIIFIIITLKLQREELDAQRQQINAQKKEFQTSAIVNVVYQQLVRLEDAISKVEFSIKGKNYVGVTAFLMLRDYKFPILLNKYDWEDDGTIKELSSDQIDNLSQKLSLYLESLSENEVEFTSFSLSFHNSLNVIKIFLKKNKEYSNETLDAIKQIYFGNIDEVIIPVISTFHRVVQCYSFLLKHKKIDNRSWNMLSTADTYLKAVLDFEKIVKKKN